MVNFLLSGRKSCTLYLMDKQILVWNVFEVRNWTLRCFRLLNILSPRIASSNWLLKQLPQICSRNLGIYFADNMVRIQVLISSTLFCCKAIKQCQCATSTAAVACCPSNSQSQFTNKSSIIKLRKMSTSRCCKHSYNVCLFSENAQCFWAMLRLSTSCRRAGATWWCTGVNAKLSSDAARLNGFVDTASAEYARGWAN